MMSSVVGVALLMSSIDYRDGQRLLSVIWLRAVGEGFAKIEMAWQRYASST